MPSKNVATYPCNPVTERGVSTKLSVSKDKLVYSNGRTVIVSRILHLLLRTDVDRLDGTLSVLVDLVP